MLTEKLIKTKPNSKVMLSVAMLIIVTMAMYNWVIRPQTTYLHAARQYEAMMGDTGKKANLVRERIEIKKHEISGLEIEMAETQDSFFTPGRAREFYSDLDPISVEYNCDIVSRNFSPASTVSSDDDEHVFDGISLERVEICLTGEYQNIIKFLERLSNYSQRIYISNLIIESANRQTSRLVSYMTITIYLIEDKEMAIENKEIAIDE